MGYIGGSAGDSFDLLDGLARLPPAEQSTIAALLRETHVANLLRGSAAFEKRVAEAKSHFECLSSTSRLAYIREQIASRSSIEISAPNPMLTQLWLATVAGRRDIAVEGRSAVEVAREVRDFFLKHMERQMQERLAKATPEQRRRMGEKLEQEFGKLKPEEREALRIGLKVDQLTAEAISKALMSGGVLTAVVTANAAGFAAYMALSSAIHFVFTTILGITLPFAAYTFASSLLALTLVWALPLAGVFIGTRAIKMGQQMNADLLELACAMAAMAHQGVQGQERRPTPVLGSQVRELITGMVTEGRALDAERRRIAGLREEVAQAESELFKRSSLTLAAEKRALLAIEGQKAAPCDTGAQADIDAALALAEEAERKRLEEQARHNAETARLAAERDAALRQVESAKSALAREEEGHHKRKSGATRTAERILHAALPGLRFHRRVAEWMAEQVDGGVIESALEVLRRMVQGDVMTGDHGTMTSGFRHLAFSGAHRVYYTLRGGLQVILIGDKNSQKSDENWLRSQPAIEA